MDCPYSAKNMLGTNCTLPLTATGPTELPCLQMSGKLFQKLLRREPRYRWAALVEIFSLEFILVNDRHSNGLMLAAGGKHVLYHSSSRLSHSRKDVESSFAKSFGTAACVDITQHEFMKQLLNNILTQNLMLKTQGHKA